MMSTIKIITWATSLCLVTLISGCSATQLLQEDAESQQTTSSEVAENEVAPSNNPTPSLL